LGGKFENTKDLRRTYEKDPLFLFRHLSKTMHTQVCCKYWWFIHTTRLQVLMRFNVLRGIPTGSKGGKKKSFTAVWGYQQHSPLTTLVYLEPFVFLNSVVCLTILWLWSHIL